MPSGISNNRIFPVEFRWNPATKNFAIYSEFIFRSNQSDDDSFYSEIYVKGEDGASTVSITLNDTDYFRCLQGDGVRIFEDFHFQGGITTGVGDTAGISTTITTASLVGKTATFTNGILTGFA